MFRLGEGYWYGVAGTNIVDQDSNIQAINKCLEFGVIVVAVGSKVHGQDFGGGIVFGLDLCCQSFEFAGGAGHEKGGVASARKLKGKLLANAIRSSGDEGPRFGGLAKCAELRILL